MTNLQKLDLVIWARFGEDEEFDAEHWGTQDREHLRQEGLMKYEVVWRGHSPYTDGWEAILVEQDTTETFIWRRWQGQQAEVQEVSLPRGLCGKVATLAWTLVAVDGKVWSGVAVASTMRSISVGCRPACSSARLAASVARLPVVSPSDAM